MQRRDCAIVRARSWLTGHPGVLIVGLALLWMAAPRPAWGQSSWPGYPNNTAISVTSGGNVGIGTTSPATLLEVRGSPNNYVGMLQLVALGNNAGISFFDADGSANGRHWQIQNNYWAHGNLDFMRSTSNTGDPTTPVLSLDLNGNVGLGTTSPQYKLAVNGTIGAKDVIVTNTGWPDYVFRPGYRLRPLSEVGAYIQAHHHLPGIPSEAEVQQNGVSVGEMQAKLLAKIEELTLHMIQQEKENRALRARVARLENGTAGSGAPAAGRSMAQGPAPMGASQAASASASSDKVHARAGSRRQRGERSEMERGKTE